MPHERSVLKICEYDQRCDDPRVTPWSSKGADSEVFEADFGCAGCDYDCSCEGYGFQRKASCGRHDGREEPRIMYKKSII